MGATIAVAIQRGEAVVKRETRRLSAARPSARAIVNAASAGPRLANKWRYGVSSTSVHPSDVATSGSHPAHVSAYANAKNAISRRMEHDGDASPRPSLLTEPDPGA